MKSNIVLVNNYFTLSEARDLIRDLIQTKINFHKLRRLSKTEGSSNADTTFDDLRIQYLQDQLTKLESISGEEVHIRCDIEVNGFENWDI